MTLFKQILLGAIVFILIIIAIVGVKNYQTTNDFINEQLSANAKHTATSLGLSIATLDNVDKDSVELMINAIFDSGYYQEIKFTNADDEIIYDKSKEKVFYGVSDLFVKLVNISTPVESFEIRQWSKIGTIYVQISPAFAYEQLYTTLKELFINLVIIFIVSMILIYFSLKAILAPLNKVRKQAEAILEHEFIIQNKLPFTQEVRKMVMAMNSMVGKVKDIFDKESEILDKYNDLLYKDDRTKLFNRRYFINKFESIKSREEHSNGYCFLLSIKETYNLKKILGFNKSIEFLGRLSDILKDNDKLFDNECVFSLNENDFIVLGQYSENFEENCKNYLNKIKDLFKEFDIDDNEFIISGALSTYEGKKLNELLAELDLLLIKNKNNYSLNKSNTNDNIILGKEKFKEFIYNAMNNNDFCFASQEVLDDDNNIFHKELYLRLKYKNELKNASYFMPIVNELNLAKELDLYVLTKAFNEEFETGISVNISNDLIKSDNYSLLEKIFKTKKNNKIALELAMSKELNIRNLIAFSRFTKAYDIALGLDHFTLNKDNLSILNELNISYIKVQARTLLDLLEDVNASGARNALEIILNSKGIKIVAIGIEDEDTYKKIKDLNINLVQGNYTSQVKEEK